MKYSFRNGASKTHVDKGEYSNVNIFYECPLLTSPLLVNVVHEQLFFVIAVQLVAKVTAFPAMTASTTSMTSYTGYGPAKVPGSPTGSLGGCTSPDSTTMVLSNGFEASLYDEFLSSGSKRYQYVPQQQSNTSQFLPHPLPQQQQQQQHEQQQQTQRNYGVVMAKREEGHYSR